MNMANNPSEPESLDVKPLCLSSLKSLQCLKIISTDDERTVHVFRNELTLMAMVLSSSTSPVHIRSIILETSFGGQSPWEWHIPSILTLDKWLPIDKILASTLFRDLCMVEVTVNSYHPTSLEERSKIEWLDSSFDLGEFDFMALLPTISYYSTLTHNAYDRSV